MLEFVICLFRNQKETETSGKNMEKSSTVRFKKKKGKKKLEPQRLYF